MKQKNIVATLYLKDGHAVRSMTDFTPVDANVYRLCQLYNDSGVDKIIIFDLSTSDDEHEKNVNTIRNINRNIDIKVCAGGNINRLEDIKKLSQGTIRISQGNCSCNKRIFFSSAAMVKRSLGITRMVASLAIRSGCFHCSK